VGNQDITVKTAQGRDRTIWGASQNCLLGSSSTVKLDSSTSSAAAKDVEERKPAARDNEKTVEDIEFNDDVTVNPTDNLEDINSGIFNSATQRCQSTMTLNR
jgi:hypothetical protein